MRTIYIVSRVRASDLAEMPIAAFTKEEQAHKMRKTLEDQSNGVYEVRAVTLYEGIF